MPRVRLPDGSFIPDETFDLETFLAHGASTYDPQKAHQYYEEHKHLKGRRKGTTYNVKTASGSVTLTAKQLQEQRIFANKRVALIKNRLADLGAKLRERMAAARKAEADAKKPKTAAEKRKEADDAKKYRDKHKQELKNKAKKADDKKSDTPSKKTDSVASLKVEIADAKSSLKNAVAQQRALASATRNG